MNVGQYLLVNLQFVIRFRASLSHMHLPVALPCRLHPRNFDERKEGLLTSHLNTLAGSLPQGTISTTHFADKSTGANGMETRFSLGLDTS